MSQAAKEQPYEKDWTAAWQRNLERYYQGPARCALWLEETFPLERWSVLEIAAGSCRDSIHLAQKGYDVTATDALEGIISEVKRRFPDSPGRFMTEDAANLSFPDKSFDLSFHNGFWINFESDDDLRVFLREQARVTRRCLLILVHNAKNPRLVAQFARAAETDELYNIRFFTASEVEDLVRTSGLPYQRLELLKFGGLVDGFVRPRFFGIPNPLAPLALKVLPKLYRFQPWIAVERIACAVWL